jgi:putative ABC transport system ATP-binding protein
MALISLESVVKTYHMGDVDVHALKGVTLSIERGEFVAIVGASGSGKSTLMNLIGCLDKPTSGRYQLDGKDVSKSSRSELAQVRNLSIGFIFQNFNLLARTSALENVELPLLYSGVASKERKARAGEALQKVGLGDRLDHHPSQLSGGQQQRVAVARALVNRPPLLLADEPTGALDSKTSADLMQLLQDLSDSGMTVVLVTHDAEVAAYARRLVVVKDGSILEDRPQSPKA